MSRSARARPRMPALVLVLALLCMPAYAPAQSAPAEEPDGFARITAAAQEAGIPVVIIGAQIPPAGAGQSAAAVPVSERAAAISREIAERSERALADLGAAPEVLPALLERQSGSPETGWLWRAIGITLGALLLGGLIERLAGAWLRTLFRAVPPSPEAERSARIRYTLLRAAIIAGSAAIGIGVAFLIAAIVLRGTGPGAALALSIFEAVVLIRVAFIFFRVVLAPRESAARLFDIDDARARGTYRLLVGGGILTGGVAATSIWFDRISAPAGLVDLSEILTAALGALTIGLGASRIRRARTAPAGASPAPWLVRSWHSLVIAYLVAAVAATALGRLAGFRTEGLVIAPITAALLSAILYAIALLAVDRAFASPPGVAGEEGPSFRRWGERSALAVAGAAAIGIVLHAWGADLFEATGEMRPIFTILIVLIAAWVGWSAIRTAFDIRIARERAAQGPEQDEAEEGGAGGTRLATILPLFRNAILIAIVVIAGMVVLSSVGVDVAPLFAGAGLVGIAVGFGAQTLVRDIFSGVFFLIDDAFRVGEYIDTGGAKGTVERISIRSMQLRHHTGPLHTIPFGEILQLTNFSRDWVIMKLPIRVRFGTDTERVRKLIKKLGQALLDDPVIGAKFVEPLKSQGVYQMDEYGIIIRVKFKTRPGDQFAVRKVVYQKINELFEQEGIAFGGREVVVRAAEGGPAGRDLSPEDVAAAGAAAAAASGAGQR